MPGAGGCVRPTRYLLHTRSPLVGAPRMSGVNALARLGLKQVVGLAAVDVEAGSGD